MVVMKGPEASAGLNPSLFSTRGVTVPTKEAKITTLKRAIETIGMPYNGISLNFGVKSC